MEESFSRAIAVPSRLSISTFGASPQPKTVERKEGLSTLAEAAERTAGRSRIMKCRDAGSRRQLKVGNCNYVLSIVQFVIHTNYTKYATNFEKAMDETVEALGGLPSFLRLSIRVHRLLSGIEFSASLPRAASSLFLSTNNVLPATLPSLSIDYAILKRLCIIFRPFLWIWRQPWLSFSLIHESPSPWRSKRVPRCPIEYSTNFRRRRRRWWI